MSLFRTTLRRLRSIPTATTALRTMSTSATPMEDTIREKVPTTYLPIQPLQAQKHSRIHANTQYYADNGLPKPLDPRHPQRLTPPRPPRRNGRVDVARDAFSVRPLHPASKLGAFILHITTPCTYVVAQFHRNGINVWWCSVTITSPSFASKMQPARHRMVYALLKEEMSAEGGIHALQLRTRTPEEEERQQAQQVQ